MRKIDLTADQLVSALLTLSETEPVCLLDSSGVSHLGSHLLIAGVRPLDVIEVWDTDPERTLWVLNERVAGPFATFFTLSYDLGAKLLGLRGRSSQDREPDAFVSTFDTLIVHDYDSSRTMLSGNKARFDEIEKALITAVRERTEPHPLQNKSAASNFTRAKYIDSIDTIKERIRAGDTYQTNLTQQLTVPLDDGLTPAGVFQDLRRNHPAPFAAFITRGDSTVVSASPERFFRIVGDKITTSPIKGTRPRGASSEEDDALRRELLTSVKDRAENTMIVDLLRNDLGRVCEYGSVEVEKLCDLEEHPTLFHLVSTVSGQLRRDATFADVIRALFPCGSITGAPKISTMRIIDELEKTHRGLSMGAIGYSVPTGFDALEPVIDLSVAIRTMVFRDGSVTFNVGGGIVIDSDPQKEYEESLLKAKALLYALTANLE
ncbi:MAG TPA: aminodeoxychorismate synthase component I [Pyrinomonadaceae bacterium]|nr:aminodeoxychorismate synthase component I [Pyrinomonadaceae bacterium]